MRWNFTSQFAVDVQFEDIDGGGVVHHPNYLKYLERARCQAMREIGVPFEQCLKDGVAFVVAELNSKYLRPLQFGQRVFVLTRLVAVRKSSLKVFQKIIAEPPSQEILAADQDFFSNSGRACFFAQLRLVAVALQDARPTPLPEHIRIAAGCPDAETHVQQPEFSDVRLLPFSSDNT